MLEIDRLGDARLGRQQFLGAARRRRQERHRPPGDAAAMARTKGRCQMTSPMPGLTWMTALARHVACRVKGCDMRLLGEAPVGQPESHVDEPCAPTCSISPCRRTASRCGRRRRAMPRGFWWCVRARRSSSRIATMRDLPALLRRGDALVVNDTKVFAARICMAAGSAAAASQRSRARDRGDADQAARRLALARAGAAGEAAQARRHRALRQPKAGSASSTSSTPRSKAKEARAAR